MKKTSLILFALQLVIFSYAQTGKPDPAFGNGGSVIYSIPPASGFTEFFNTAIQTDGRIVSVGVTTEKGRPNFLITRYNSDGSTDNSFNGNGKIIPEFNLGNQTAQDVAIQADGKIVVAGQGFVTPGTLWLIVARYNTDGSVDNSFNGTGSSVTPGDITGTGGYHYMVLQSDGRIVVSGSRSMRRFNTDGSLDTNFGEGFKRFGDIYALSRQADNKILAAGTTPTQDGDFFLARYNSNGSVDSSFDSDGVVYTNMGGTDQARSIAVQTDGKILVAGTVISNTNKNLQFAIARYNSNGTPDNSFDGDGKTVTDFGSAFGQISYSYPLGVTVQENGKIVVGGDALAIYNTNGSLDKSYQWDGGSVAGTYGAHRVIIRDKRLYASGSKIVGYLLEDGLANGLYYKYFEGSWTTLPDFNNLMPAKIGNSPNVDISVRPAGQDDNFAFIWRGYINITAPGTYTFETESDDGSKVYFNTSYSAAAIAAVNNDGIHAATPTAGMVNIPSAGVYPITFTFFEKDGNESMRVYWTGPGITRQLIPNTAFTSDSPVTPPSEGLSYKYYEGSWDNLPDFNALIPLKTGKTPNVDLSVRTPGRNDNFAFVWEGNINITTPGEYTFTTVSDDGSKIYFNSLYLPSATPTVTNDGLHPATPVSGTVNIPSAGSYPIAITFFEKDGEESMKVYWSGPGIPMQLIPNSAFSKSANPAYGLNYKYYEGNWNVLPDFSTLTPLKTGTSANLDLNERAPGRTDNFGFVWEGYLTVPTPGDYTLELVSDDGSKLYYNSFYSPLAAAYINNDGLHPAVAATGTVHIEGTVPIAITYFEKDGAENMEFYWSGPGIPRQRVPNSAFTHANAALSTGVDKNTNSSLATALENGSGVSTITKIYPNPFAERFIIDFNNNKATDDISIAIYDLGGKQLYSQHAGHLPQGNTSLVVSLKNKELKEGVYLVTVKKNGVIARTVKLIKQK